MAWTARERSMASIRREASIDVSGMPGLQSIQQILGPLFPGLMGLRLVEVSAERVVAQIDVRPDLCTTGGVMHGGAIMAFADTLGAVGTFMNMPQGKRTTTTDSSTKFTGAAPVNTTVTGECVPFHRGRTTMVWQTTVKSAQGKLVAVVTQTQLLLDS